MRQLRFSLVSLFILFLSSSLYANTQKHTLQVSGDLGMFVASDGLDASFDFAIEPEFFIIDNLSASFRFDVTAGDLDSVTLAGRVRYYLDIPNHEKWSVYFGAGVGVLINLDGPNFADHSLPVVGFQYDFSDHIKIGSDFSFDILLNGDSTAIGARIMPVQFRWAF